MSDRCPRCSALVSAAASWCGLCHADLRPAPEPVPATDGVTVPHAVAVSQQVAAVPQTVGAPQPVAGGGSAAEPTGAAAAPSPRRGKHARPVPAEPTTSPLPSEVDPQPVAPGSSLEGIDLSVLAGGTSDPVAQWSQKLGTPGAKVGVMVAGIAVVGAVGLLLLTVAGMVIG